ncbi:MAG: hypothetical protein J5I65_09775 [Aridibacter famidurans]|nr:hypothetical protein [Aridibacter famidurans]
MFLRTLIAASFVFAVLVSAARAQDVEPKTDVQNEPEVKVDLTKEQTDGIQVAESAIVVYSGLRGRVGLGQIRKTTVEVGTTTYTEGNGSKRNAEYVQRIIRGESFEDEKIRLDQKFPNADYALIYDGGKIFGVISNTVFSPREDAEDEFRNRLVHGVDALLRYRENGSNIVLKESDKIMGVDYYVILMTDKEGRETTYYVSKKTLRVMMLRYEHDGIKYERKFYDHNYAQGTLVPYRTVLKADGKQIEESTIATVTFGQSVQESLFSFSAA